MIQRTRLVIVLIVALALLSVGFAAIAGRAIPATNTPNSVDTSEQPSYSGKKVLFVNSYHEGYEWSDGIEKGLHAILDKTNVQVRFVRLDTKRYTDPAAMEAAGKAAKAEIDTFKPHVVIAADDNAQKLLVKPYLNDTDLPVLFVGVNWDTSAYAFDPKHITGMVEVELIEQLVKHLKGYAKGDRIAYVTVDSETEQKVISEYNKRFFNGKMQAYSVKTFDEFVLAFQKAQQEADIVLLGNNAGADRWDIAEARTSILSRTTVPTGSINSWMADYALLTLAKIPEEQGEWAAQTTLRIFDGTPVSSIPVAENTKGKLILNMAAAERLNVIFTPSMLRSADIIEATPAAQPTGGK